MMQHELSGMRVFAWLGVIAGSMLGLARADELVDQSIRVGGKDRTYHVHKDKTPTKPLPLVVVLHGGGGNGRLLKDTYGLKPMIAAREFVAVYPDALAGGWVPDDVAFIDAVIEEVFVREKVDRERLFVTGASRGGLLTFVMAAKSKHKIRAAGTVIASQLAGLAREFPFSRPLDFLMIAGTADPLMPYCGGWGNLGKAKDSGDADARVLPVEEVIQLLLKADGITGEPKVSSLGDADPDDGCTNEVRVWRDSQTGRRVALVKVEGGGHVVPGGGQYLAKSAIGAACKDFDHAEVMWKFFKTSSGASQAVVSSPPASTSILDAAGEKALRERVAALFEALRTGDVEQCLALSDPAVVRAKGPATAEKFFKGVSGLVRLAKVKPEDRTIKSISLSDDGQTARVTIELKLNGRAQPPAVEVWGLVDGKWHYRETAK